MDIPRSLSSQLLKKHYTINNLKKVNTSTFKVPFINEDIKHRTQAITRRTGLNNKIKLIFNNGKKLGLLYKPPKERQQCTENTVKPAI